MLGFRVLCVLLAFRVCNADRVTPTVRVLQPIQPTEATARIHEVQTAAAMQDISTDKARSITKANSKEQPSGDVKGDVEPAEKPWHEMVVATTEAATTTKEATTTQEVTTTTEVLCTVPTISTGVQSWSGTNCASEAANVVAGTTCTITAASGYTCTSPGLCGSDGKFAAFGACQEVSCTVPTISTGVGSWSGTNCASGADNVGLGTVCIITAASGYTCTSPGLCGIYGNFQATGACQKAPTTTVKSTVEEAWKNRPMDPRLQEARDNLKTILWHEKPEQKTVDENDFKTLSDGKQTVIYKYAGFKNLYQQGGNQTLTQEKSAKSGNNTSADGGKIFVYAIQTLEEQSSYYLEQFPDWLEWTLYIIGVVVGSLAIWFLHMAKYRPVHGCATVFCVFYCCPCGFLSLCFPLDEATPESPSLPPYMDHSRTYDPLLGMRGAMNIMANEQAEQDQIEAESRRMAQEAGPAGGDVAR